MFSFYTSWLSQPHFGQVWGWSPTLGKVRGWESSGTPECSELDSKGQNTSHWGVIGVIGKVLKRRYRKWPRIGNSDICSPSYGQKKGRESNWQSIMDLFPTSNLSVRHGVGKISTRATSLVQTSSCSRELWRFKVLGVPPRPFRDSISGVPGICAIRM